MMHRVGPVVPKMAATVNFRPLKRPRLGPPDYYPQDSKQREDQLTEENVRKGFTYQPLTNPVEYGSAKDILNNVPLSKFSQSFKAVLHEKQKHNTYQDANKKKSQVVKENFWPVTARSHALLNQWFQELSGSKPLSFLAKKVPIFNKKEEIFSSLCEHTVPMLRAAWFIKMTSQYNNYMSEVKIKKRIMADPSLDWTHTLTKYLKEQLNKIFDYYQGHFTGSQHQARMTPEVEQAMKKWNYTIRLANWLYEEYLLDRQEFLQWLLDLLEKSKTSDDVLLKFLVPLISRYVDQMVLTHTLARNLARVCTRKLSSLYSAAEQMQSEQQGQAPVAGQRTNSGLAPSPLAVNSESCAAPPSTGQQSVLTQYKSCPQHQALVLALSSILQTITLRCPGALVWNPSSLASGGSSGTGVSAAGGNTAADSKSALLGSPLDRLPVGPSSLPLPSAICSQQQHNSELLKVLLASEEEIRTRSQAVESRWSPDKYQDKSSIVAVSRVLNTLEILDKYNFSRADSASCIDPLYSKIFTTPAKEVTELPATDEAITLLLCEWAVSKHRVGKYRALIVAKLLHKRQLELQGEADDSSSDQGDEGTAPAALTATATAAAPLFQNALLNFLDNYAPVVDGYQHSKGDKGFAQLTLLFGELIRSDVFSHNAYMCTLISRGELQPTPLVALPSPPRVDRRVQPSEVEPLDTEECVQEGDAQLGLVLPLATISEDEFPKKNELSSDNELKMSQMALDQELLLHQQRLQQLLDQGDSAEPFLDQEPHLQGVHALGTADSSAKLDMENLMQTSAMCDQRDDTSADGAHAFSKKSQHVQYATHFPIPQENFTAHESNQRLVLLYGVGKARKEVLANTKEATKTLCTMLTALGNASGPPDTAPGGNPENTQREERKAALYNKFSSLSCFDQYVAGFKCVSALKELRAANSAQFGLSGKLPTTEQLNFIFDLFELSGDVYGLLDFIADMLMPSEHSLAPVRHAPYSAAALGTLPSKSVIVLSMLRRYHACLMVMPQHTARVFRGLLATVDIIEDPGRCSSADRCILAYLFDLYSSCSQLKVKFADIFSTAYTKIKQAICVSTTPSASTEQYNSKFMAEFFYNPRTERLDAIWDRGFFQKPSDYYSFVCNAMLNVCNCQNSRRLFDIGVLCAEVTAHYTRLSSEWLGVLRALCCSSDSAGFVDLLLEVDVGDLSIHESIATFTALLISRHCFSLEDVTYHVAVPSLLAALPPGNEIQEAESGARLACHLLLRLLDESTDLMSHDHSVASKLPFKSSPDHHLLSASHDSVGVGAVLAVLKAMLKLSEAGRSGDGAAPGTGDSGRDELSLFPSRMDEFMDSAPGSSDIFPLPLAPSRSAMETSSTSAFAGFALQVICRQEWVRERCLQDPLKLCSAELLFDPWLSSNQARKLLTLICSPADFLSSFDGPALPISSSNDMETVQEAAKRIFQNLDQWTLRRSWLELQLMIKQAPKEETGPLLDAIATGAMNVFVQRHDITPAAAAHNNQKSVVIKGAEWLVAPLITKLSSPVQGRLLKAAGDVLGTRQWWKEHSDKSPTPTLVHSQPFLSLVMACLKGHEDQRDGLLASINRQLSQLLAAPPQERCPSDRKSQEVLQEALHLRISLVGAMFDTIQRSSQLSADWATLLFQLVNSGTITPDSLPTKKELFTSVLDMVSVLINVVSSADSLGQSVEESRKATMALFKKLKREFAGKSPSDILMQCKELLPLPSQSHNLFTMERTQPSGDKAVTGPGSQGLQLSGKQRISSWDLMEGQKTPAPFAWAWFGAVRSERKPLRYEEEFRKLLHHTHPRRKPMSYFLTPTPDDEDDDDDDDKADTETGAGELGLSQPSTPQTPADKGLPGSGAVLAPSHPTNMAPEEGAPMEDKSSKTKAPRRKRQRQPSTTQQRKQTMQQQQQQPPPQQQQQQQQQQYLRPPQIVYNTQQFYQQQQQQGLAGQAYLSPQRVGTPTALPPNPMDPLHSMLANTNQASQPTINAQPQTTPQRRQQPQPHTFTALQRKLLRRQQSKQQQQQQQKQQQSQASQQTIYSLQQQLQSQQQKQQQQQQQPATQLQQQAQQSQLRHMPSPNVSIGGPRAQLLPSQVAALRAGQQFNFNQAQRPQVASSLPVARAQVTRPNLAAAVSTPTSLVSSASALSSESGFGSQGFAGTRTPQSQAQQQYNAIQGQRTLQPHSAPAGIPHTVPVSSTHAQIGQATQQLQNLQYNQLAANRVGMRQLLAMKQQQQQQQQQQNQQQQQQQQQNQQQPQGNPITSEILRQFQRQLSGGAQDLPFQQHFPQENALQRQLSAPSELGLQRQAAPNQEMAFQRQISTPAPQDLARQGQPQQFTANPSYTPGPF